MEFRHGRTECGHDNADVANGFSRSDQFVNSKLLMDDLGVAKQVCEGGGADSVLDSVQLESLLQESVNGCTHERLKMKNLSEILFFAQLLKVKVSTIFH